MTVICPETNDIYKTETRSLKENIEYYRKKLRYATNESEDVMKRFYDIPSNHCRPMVVEKVTLDRIINKHGDNGLINISAWRSSKDDDTNTENTRSLIRDLQQSGYSYLPGYGGYRDPKIGEESNFEPSFNVFNYNIKGEPQDFEKLKEFGVSLARKYDQSSVLVKAPGEPPVWLDGEGRQVSKEETDKVFKNDSKQEYFTSLKTLDDVEKQKTDYLRGQYKKYCADKGIGFNEKNFEDFCRNHGKEAPVSRRYTYDMQWKGLGECYVNPSPCDMNERRMRTSAGEILVDLELL